MKRKSQKAFESNIKAEMDSGKPQKQALAIAYSVKRRSKKASGGMVKSGSKDMDMAHGGLAKEELHYEKDHKAEHSPSMLAEGGDISASNEKRPMPENEYNDSAMAKRNSSKKELKDSDWTDQPELKQTRRGSRTERIKHPSMVPSNAFSARLYDQEGNLEESMPPSSDKDQPDKWMDEEGANRQGPAISDMEDEHSTHKKPYKQAASHDMESKQRSEAKEIDRFAKGGQVEESDYHGNIQSADEELDHTRDHDIERRERLDELDMQSELDPSEDEGSSMAHSENEERPDRHGDDVSDMEIPHNKYQRSAYAEGGSIEHEMMEQPEEEADLMHASSIAAAIMSKRRMAREDGMSGSDDMNEAENYVYGGVVHKDKDGQVYAKGGMAGDKHGKINSHGSWDTHEDVDQADLSRNADEDANEEDQMSFQSLKKENYSESEGLNQLDSPEDSNLHGDDEESEAENDHDESMVDKIRRKMRMKSPMVR